MKKSELKKIIKEEIQKLNESVYKEGFIIVEKLMKMSSRIYKDAADYGIPSKKNDKV